MTAPGPPARPHVLLIQADQFRWDCLGAAGHPDVATPHLDRLAADGVLHGDAFCPLPICTPSRYSLLTGLYPHQHAGWTNHSTLPPAVPTFPGALRAAGYRTAAVGKMHFTPTYLDVGYDRMLLAEQHGPGRYDDDYHRDLRAAGITPVLDLLDQEEHLRPAAPDSYWESYGTARSDLPEEWHSTTWIGDRALREVAGWEPGGGQLLHVSFIKPHHPFDPPAPWDELYDPDALTLPPGWTERIPPPDLRHRDAYFDYEGLTEPVLRRVMAHYYGSITHLDHHIGRLVDALRRRGLYDETMIVFTSDHGEYLGFHHLLLKNGPLYDPLVRVPLVVKYPAAPGTRPRRGERNDALVSLVDLAPTVLSACGVPPPPDLPGHDLTDPGAGRDCVFAENRRGGAVAMARTRTHKLLVGADPADDALFDLREDPLERRNRLGAPDSGAVAADLRERLLRWVAFDTPPPPYLDEDAAVIEAPNVPPRDPARRAEHAAHFAAAVREAARSPAPDHPNAPTAGRERAQEPHHPHHQQKGRP
ncbi:sulfatase [Streptomyces sp. SBT349]|uniref:sulfatase family protein n=1 Tax=Streptomyces sp. SBT349 TaxID=1580539 RepID=UPI0007C76745|nr:sulfatase-like hydrolase/transferase [Streptomyces sp. SBT349]